MSWQNLKSNIYSNVTNLPWTNIARLLHYGTERKPKWVVKWKIIWNWRTRECFFKSPLVLWKSRHEEHYNWNTAVRKNYANPNFLTEWIHEWKYSWIFFHWFLDHNRDSEGHEWLGEINYTFTSRCYCEGGDCDVRFLINWLMMDSFCICPCYSRFISLLRHFIRSSWHWVNW